MESPQEQPQQQSAPVLSTPQQTEKKFPLVWVVIGIAILLLMCGSAGAFYIWSSKPSDQANLNADSNETLHWVSGSALVDANLGYTLSGTELYFNGDRKQHYADSFEVAEFGDTLSLPTYGIDKKFPDQVLLYFITKDGISAGGRNFDERSFTPLKTPAEDNSCGYPCRYDAYDKNSKYLALAVYPSLPQNADAATFVPLYAPDGTFTGYARDKNNLYASFDTDSFSLMSNTYGTLAIDATTFEALGGGYYKDKNKVYQETWQDFSVVKDADPNSIRYDSNSDIAKDASHVYLYGRLIVNADPASFAVVYPNEYYKDKNYVWETGLNLTTRILEGADPLTFTYDRESDVAKDSKHVWIDGRNGTITALVPNVDPSTFVALNFNYYKDSGGIYYGFHNLVPVSVDKDSFKVYFPVFWKDDDEERFVVGYAADKNNVYYQGRPIAGADVATFAPVSGSYSGDPSYFSDASDKNHKYKWGKVVE
ncbi:DKNYY domain-containing protein [Acetobacteraceae bacterium]|nr:DKNYY domain-containing protein [Candidatus Parcubacteria bacterium]